MKFVLNDAHFIFQGFLSFAVFGFNKIFFNFISFERYIFKILQSNEGPKIEETLLKADCNLFSRIEPYYTRALGRIYVYV